MARLALLGLLAGLSAPVSASLGPGIGTGVSYDAIYLPSSNPSYPPVVSWEDVLKSLFDGLEEVNPQLPSSYEALGTIPGGAADLVHPSDAGALPYSPDSSRSMAIPHYPAGVSPSWLPESPTSSSHGTEASYPIYRSNSINIPHSDPTDNGDDSPHTPPKSLLEDYLLNKRARIESHPDPTPNPKLKRAHVKPNSSYSLKQTIKQCKALSSQIFHYTAPSDQRPSENGPVKAFYAQARSQIHDFFSYLKTKMAPSPGDHAYYSQPFATKVSKLIHSVKYNPMPYYLYATDWDAHLGDFRPYFLTDPQGFRCDDLIQLNSTGSPFIRFSKIPLTLDHQTIKQIINGHIARSAKSWRLAYPEYISQLQMMQ